jgi:tartrate-resistant acid phosphatase type 5
MSNTKKIIVLLPLIGFLIIGSMFGHPIKSAASSTHGTIVLQNDQLIPSPSSQEIIFFPLVFIDTESYSELRFGVIGDYGDGSQAESDVAALVKSWDPDFIITTGDNNYPDGEADTIDENIGQFFHEFIFPYTGSYGAGALENRFFPSLGNHDWHTPDAQPYLDYFTLPGNERYYDFTWGPVHFFAVDSDSDEPDGADSDSIQANWLQSGLSTSDSIWKIVYFHHAPYSSGSHGSNESMQWPFAEWGADVVISGHDHTYERISRDGITYFVNGVGGASRYDFFDIVEGSQVRYNDDYGAMLVESSGDVMQFQFINRQGMVVDVVELVKSQSH